MVQAWQPVHVMQNSPPEKACPQGWSSERCSAMCRDLVNEPRCQDCHPGTIAVSTSSSC